MMFLGAIELFNNEIIRLDLQEYTSDIHNLAEPHS